MKIWTHKRNHLLVFMADFLIIIISIYGSHFVRFDFNIPPQESILIKKFIPFILAIKLFSFYFFDFYRGMWRYTSLLDLLNIVKAVTVSSLIVVSLLLFLHRFEGFSRSVFIIDWFFTFFMIAGFRLFIRIYYDHANNDQLPKRIGNVVFGIFRKVNKDKTRLIIIGAGDCGEKILREINENSRLGYQVVGFLDDDIKKLGRKIHGTPVLGRISDIQEALKKMKADEVLIAIPSASAQQMRDVISHCENSHADFKIVPGYGELINGKVSIKSIRDVTYRDLLGREIVKLDAKKIGSYLENKCVLVTGAGGSIGSELCRQICRFQPSIILLLDKAESSLYEIDLEIRKNFSSIGCIPILADITDREELSYMFEKYHPSVVFHAAAYKHVPMLELQPWKAIRNNIIGTRNMVVLSRQFFVERFVFVSTDKAVRPANIMGASKRCSELLVQGQDICDQSKTRFMIVRFGNVVGSVGSVIPLFKKQIAEGGPVTVTHPEITRYFMTIPEASQLILQAGAMGSGGEIFILDMGKPIKIVDIAKDLIKLSGYEPIVDIPIEFIGLRPGEKLYEELITEGEGIIPTAHQKIMVLKGIQCEQYILNSHIDALEKLSHEQNSESIKERLREIIPEYKPEKTGIKNETDSGKPGLGTNIIFPNVISN